MAGLKKLVVGGAAGLVQDFLVAAARAGDELAITGRDEAELTKIAASIAEQAPGSIPVRVFAMKNPLDENEIRLLVQQLRAAWDRIDAMVIALGAVGGDSAKVLPGKPIDSIDLDGWKECAELNLWAPLRYQKIVGAWMMEQPTPAAIVFIGSISSHEVLTVVGGYGTSKAGLSVGYRMIALEMTAQRCERKLPPINVNEIAPGFFPTEQNAAMLTGDRRHSILARTPFGEFGTPAHLVGAFELLTTPGSFHHLSRIVVDGGFSGNAAVLSNRPAGTAS